MTARILLILPCNQCVRHGDYSLCPNWRIILRTIGDLVEYGILDLAAIDSCKPGIVLHGEERDLLWCDTHPGYQLYYHRQPWRLPLLTEAVERDLRQLFTRYHHIVYYVNVKAYREALNTATQRISIDRITNAGPPHPTPLSYRSKKNREKLRQIILKLHRNTGTHA